MTDRDSVLVKRDLELGTGRKQKMPGVHIGYAAAGELDPEMGEGDGVFAGVGVGQINLKTPDGDGFELTLPNIGAGVEDSKSEGFRAVVKAELVSYSASVGPVKGTVGLSADTVAGIGRSGVEAKVLGTGFSFGRKMGLSFLGSSFEFELW